MRLIKKFKHERKHIVINLDLYFQRNINETNLNKNQQILDIADIIDIKDIDEIIKNNKITRFLKKKKKEKLRQFMIINQQKIIKINQMIDLTRSVLL